MGTTNLVLSPFYYYLVSLEADDYSETLVADTMRRMIQLGAEVVAESAAVAEVGKEGRQADKSAQRHPRHLLRCCVNCCWLQEGII